MAASFKLFDVAPETIMLAAFNAANRQAAINSETTVADVQKATTLSKQQASLALDMATQLRLLEEISPPGSFKFIGDSSLRISPKAVLPQFFRAAIQQFPPYLLYLSFRVGGYNEDEAANQIASIFGFGLATKRIVSILRRWGKYAEIEDEKGQLAFTPKEILDIGFLSRLSAALSDELNTKTFVLGELGNAIAGDLYSSGLDVDAIARALVNHERDPKHSMQEAGNLLEAYLAQLSGPIGGPKSLIGPMLDYLAGAGARKILKTHKNAGYGVAGLRNAADHGSDPETGKAWSLSNEAALVGTLLVMLTIKSIERYVRDQAQEV